jgi:hypothetical protein
MPRRAQSGRTKNALILAASTPGLVVAAEERCTATPATAPDDVGAGLGDEIRAVGNEGAIEAERRAERGFDLRVAIRRRQAAHGRIDQPFERRRVRHHRRAQ